MVTCYSKVDDRIWKALSDGKRRKIIDTLSQGRKTTGEIVSLFPDLGRTTVLKHMKVLEEVKLIIVQREGRIRWNYVNTEPLKESLSPWVDQHIQGLVSAAMDLKKLAEKDKKFRRLEK